MRKAVCVPCQREYRPETNETYVVEMASFGPYKIWMADTWQCPQCHHQIVSGFGMNAIKEHYQEGFTDLLEELKETKRVEYCYE